MNNELLYIHKQSNHPPSVTKQIPAMICKRISSFTGDKVCFNKAAPDYNNTLQNRGFNKNISSHHHLLKEENTAKALRLIHRLARTLRPMLGWENIFATPRPALSKTA